MADERNDELTEQELTEAVGGKQTGQYITFDGPHHIGERQLGKQARPTRDGKLTFRRASLD